MSTRHRLKTLVESGLGIRLFRTLPHGVDYRSDLIRRGFRPKTVIDVGANEGQAAMHFLEAFSAADIHCFEPVQSTFERLKRRVGSYSCRCVQQAVGRKVGEATVYVGDNPLTNFLIRNSPNSTGQKVAVTTIDAYAAEQRIGVIDLLKVDAEGFDMEVLAGAEQCFAEERIKFVLIEVGFHFHGQEHAPFQQIDDHLRSRRFDLFGLYNQTPCWSGANRLRFADALFAHVSTSGSAAGSPPIDDRGGVEAHGLGGHR